MDLPAPHTYVFENYSTVVSGRQVGSIFLTGENQSYEIICLSEGYILIPETGEWKDDAKDCIDLLKLLVGGNGGQNSGVAAQRGKEQERGIERKGSEKLRSEEPRVESKTSRVEGTGS